MYNRILAVLLALILVVGFAVNVSATEQKVGTMPDLSQDGSLTFLMDVDGEPLEGGSLSLYYVATLTQVTESQYDFRLLDALIADGATLDTGDLYDSEQAQALLVHARKVLGQYQSSPITEGKVRFDGLQTGLYLVWQRPEDATAGYDAIAPFLISVPKWQDGDYALDVEAGPKVPLETEPTEPPPPPPPPPPEFPHTGQLNWPIPLMAICGVVLLILGWILCAGRKRCDHEK